MFKLFLTLFVFLALSGCAQVPYGNFVKDSNKENDEYMAESSVDILMSIYPPAKTSFVLKQITPDPFGNKLVALLRERGYGVLEFSPKTEQYFKHNKNKKETSESVVNSGLSLKYVVDRFYKTNVYRVTLIVNNNPITKAFLIKGDQISEFGEWSRLNNTTVRSEI